MPEISDAGRSSFDPVNAIRALERQFNIEPGTLNVQKFAEGLGDVDVDQFIRSGTPQAGDLARMIAKYREFVRTRQGTPKDPYGDFKLFVKNPFNLTDSILRQKLVGEYVALASAGSDKARRIAAWLGKSSNVVDSNMLRSLQQMYELSGESEQGKAVAAGLMELVNLSRNRATTQYEIKTPYGFNTAVNGLHRIMVGKQSTGSDQRCFERLQLLLTQHKIDIVRRLLKVLDVWKWRNYPLVDNLPTIPQLMKAAIETPVDDTASMQLVLKMLGVIEGGTREVEYLESRLSLREINAGGSNYYRRRSVMRGSAYVDTLASYDGESGAVFEELATAQAAISRAERSYLTPTEKTNLAASKTAYRIMKDLMPRFDGIRKQWEASRRSYDRTQRSGSGGQEGSSGPATPAPSGTSGSSAPAGGPNISASPPIVTMGINVPQMSAITAVTPGMPLPLPMLTVPIL